MNNLPEKFLNFKRDFPEIFSAYEYLGEALSKGSKLNEKTRLLVKLAIAVGAGLEGAVHSHTRRALEGGCTKEEIHSVVLHSLTTIGFPPMMKAMTWVDDILNEIKE
jgi:alkylhydroperoxidase/carboxymuconolactone decarboxylase family protein YurZ